MREIGQPTRCVCCSLQSPFEKGTVQLVQSSFCESVCEPLPGIVALQENLKDLFIRCGRISECSASGEANGSEQAPAEDVCWEAGRGVRISPDKDVDIFLLICKLDVEGRFCGNLVPSKNVVLGFFRDTVAESVGFGAGEKTGGC